MERYENNTELNGYANVQIQVLVNMFNAKCTIFVHMSDGKIIEITVRFK
jgi:hypothetical protein